MLDTYAFTDSQTSPANFHVDTALASSSLIASDSEVELARELLARHSRPWTRPKISDAFRFFLLGFSSASYPEAQDMPNKDQALIGIYEVACRIYGHKWASKQVVGTHRPLID